MVICVAVDCKSDSNQGKATSFYKLLRNENLKQQWFININRNNIQSINHAEYVIIFSKQIVSNAICRSENIL